MESALGCINHAYSDVKEVLTWRHVIVSVTVGGTTWLLYTILVKPFLSPLRQIPGPPYKPVVGNMYDALKSEAMSSTLMWMKEYKSLIVRYYYLYGEGRVLVADADMVKHISVTNSRNYKRVSSIANSVIGSSFILFMSGDKHHNVRKILNPAFNMSVIGSYVGVFEDRTNQVVAMWNERIHENGKFAKVDAHMVLARLTLDIICECGFDYKLGAVEEPTSAGVHSFRRILQGARIRLSQMLPFLRSLPSKENKLLWKDREIFKSTITNMIQLKKATLGSTAAEKAHKGDLMSLLFRARDEDNKALPDNVIYDQISGFMFAGYETTSTLLTWTLLLLAEHPDIQEKLRSELTPVFSKKNGCLSLQDLEPLTFLSCVIKESLRLYPPASNIFRRAVNDDYLGKYFIPAGTVVGISVSGLHRSPENWEDPDSFKPERFLEEINPYKFQPFTAGPYMCIGHRFAMAEAKTILAILLNNFNLEMVPGYTYRRIRYLTVQPHPPLVLNVFRV